MADLENLIIQVDSELGDLSGIDSAVQALEGLKNFSEDATKGAKSLGDMANAFEKVSKFGSKKSVGKIKKDVGLLKEILTDLSSYTGKADKAIEQLAKLGDAMQHFAGLGEKLKGLENVTGGINSMVDALFRLVGISGGLKKTTSDIKGVGKAFDFSKNVNKSNKSMKESQEALKGYRKAWSDTMKKMRTDRFNAQDASGFGFKRSDNNAELKQLKEEKARKLQNYKRIQVELNEAMDKYATTKDPFEKTMVNTLRETLNGLKAEIGEIDKKVAGIKAFDFSDAVKKGMDNTAKQMEKSGSDIKALYENIIRETPFRIEDKKLGFDFSNAVKNGMDNTANQMKKSGAETKALYEKIIREIPLRIEDKNRPSIKKDSSSIQEQYKEKNIVPEVTQNVSETSGAIDHATEETNQFAEAMKDVLEASTEVEEIIKRINRSSDFIEKDQLKTQGTEKIAEYAEAIENLASDKLDSVSIHPDGLIDPFYGFSDKLSEVGRELVDTYEWIKHYNDEAYEALLEGDYDSSLTNLDKIKTAYSQFEGQFKQYQPLWENESDDTNDNMSQTAEIVNEATDNLNDMSDAMGKVAENAEKMKYILVAGSRGFNDYERLAQELDKIAANYEKIQIVSGGAKGADALAKKYAQERGYDYKEFPAEWDKYGKSAGYRRNEQMQEYISKMQDKEVVAFWDGQSKGTSHHFKPDRNGEVLSEKYGNNVKVFLQEADGELKLIKDETYQFAAGMKETAENAEKVREAVKGMNISTALKGLSEYDNKSRKRMEQAFYYDSKGGEKMSEIGTSDVPNKVTKELSDALYAQVQGFVDTFVHSHPERLAALSVDDVRAAFNRFSEGITQSVVVGFDQAAHFDTSKINKSDFGMIVEEFQNRASVLCNDFLETTIDKFSENLGKSPKNLSVSDAMLNSVKIAMGKVLNPEQLTEVWERFKEVISTAVKEYVAGMSGDMKVTPDDFGAALTDKIWSSMKGDKGGLAGNYKQLEESMQLRMRELFGNVLSGTATEDIRDAFQTKLVDALKGALESAGYVADDIYKVFPIQEFVENFKNISIPAPEIVGIDKLKEQKKELEAEIKMLQGLLSSSSDDDTAIDIDSSKIETYTKALEKANTQLAKVKAEIDRIDPEEVPFDEDFDKHEARLQREMALRQLKSNLNRKHLGTEATNKVDTPFTSESDEVIKDNEKLNEAFEERRRIYEKAPDIKDFKFKENAKSEQDEETAEGIDDMVDALKRFEEVEYAIELLGMLGEAMQSFAGLGDALASLDSLAKGIVNLVDVLGKLKEFEESDLDFLDTLRDRLTEFSKRAYDTWANAGNLTNGLANLINVLRDTEGLDFSPLDIIKTKLEALTHTKYDQIITLMRELNQAFDINNVASSKAGSGVREFVYSFENAESALYSVRENVEAISEGFNDTLDNLDLSEVVEKIKPFEQIADKLDMGDFLSGLARLIIALNNTMGSLDTSPIDALYIGLKNLANDPTLDDTVEKLKGFNEIVFSLGRLLNAIHFSELDRTKGVDIMSISFRNLKDAMLNNFGVFEDMQFKFGKLSYLLYGFKASFEALMNENDIPKDNLFTKLKDVLADPVWGELGANVEKVSLFLNNIGTMAKVFKENVTFDPDNNFLVALAAAIKRFISETDDVSGIYWALNSFMKQTINLIGVLGTEKIPENNALVQLSAILGRFKALAPDLSGIAKPLSSLTAILKMMHRFYGGKVDDKNFKNLEDIRDVILSLNGADLTNVSSSVNALSKIFVALNSFNGDVNAFTTVTAGIKDLSTVAAELKEISPTINNLNKLVNVAKEKVPEKNAFKNVSERLKEISKLKIGKEVNSLTNSLTKLVEAVGQTKGLRTGSTAIDKVYEALKKFESLTGLKGLDSIVTSLRKMIETLKESTEIEITEKNPLKQLVTLLQEFESPTKSLKELPKILKSLEKAVELVKEVPDIDYQNNGLSALLRVLKGFEVANVNLSGIDKSIKSIIKAFDLLKLVEGQDFTVDKDKNPFALIKAQLDEFKDVADDLKELKSLVDSLKNFIKLFDSSKGFTINAQPITEIIEAVKSAGGMGDAIRNYKAIIKGMKDVDKTNPQKLAAAGAAMNVLAANIDKFKTGKLQGLADIANAMLKMDKIDLDKFHAMAEAIRDITSALGQIHGSNNTIKINLDERGIASIDDGVKKAKYTWDEFIQNLKKDLESISIGKFDPAGKSTKELKEYAKEAESSLKQAQKELQKWTESRQKLEQINKPEALRNMEQYQRVISNYMREAAYVKLYKTRVQELNEELRKKDGYELDNDAQGYKLLDSLRREKEELQKFLEEFDKTPSKFMGEMSDTDFQMGMVNIASRIQEIEDIERRIHNEMKDMQPTMEGINAQAEIFRKISEENAQAWQKIHDEMTQTIGQGTSAIGESMKNMPVLNKSSMFNTAGDLVSKLGSNISSGKIKLPFDEGTIATLSKVAGSLTMVLGILGTVASVIKAIYDDLSRVRQALIDFMKSMVAFSKNMLTKVVGAFNSVTGAVSKAVSVVRSGAEGIATALRKVGDVGKQITSIFAKVGNVVPVAVKGMKAVLSLVTPSIVKTLASSGKSLTQIIKQSRTITKLIKTFTRWFSMLSRMLMRRSVTAFINEVKQAFQDLAVFEKESGDAMLQLNTNVSNIFSGLRRGANQWIAAFEPLINAVTPTILNFLNNLQAMGENVARFMAILTGQPYYIRAKKFYEDYAEGLDKAGKKAKDLTNGLDELNVLNDKNDSDGINPEDMFEKVYVDGMFNLPSIQEEWQKILDWFKDLLRKIDWDLIKEKVRDFIHTLMTLINQTLADLDLWALLGKTIAEAFNTLMEAWNQFITDFDPVLTEKAISELIVNALKNIDWALIHDNIEKTAKKFAQFWNEIFADDKLWDEMTQFIANALNEITHYFDTWAWTFDFKQMAKQLTDAVRDILEKYDWEQLRHAVEGWVKGLVDAFNEAVANKEFWASVGTAIKNVINDVIIEAVKQLANLNLVELSKSLKTAITNALDGIRWEEFTESVRKIAVELANAINDFFGDEAFLTKITTSIAKFGNAIIKAIDDFLTTLRTYDIANAVSNAFITGWNTIDWNTLFKIPADAINALSGAIRGLLDALPDGVNIADWLVSHFSITYDTVDWDLIARNVRDFAQKVVDTINGIINSDEFWSRVGDFTIRAIDIVMDLTLNPLLNVDWTGLAQRIADYVNTVVESGRLRQILASLGHLAVELVFSIDIFLRGVDWSALGQQIAAGISDVVDDLYTNRNKIRKTIEDAFSSVSDLISGVLKEMLQRNSFYKLGTTMGEVLLGIINGIAIFFDDNGTNIIKAIREFADGLANFIKKNENQIVRSLTTIINAVADIINAFFDERGKLHDVILDIGEKLKKPIGKLLGTLVSVIIRNFTEKLEDLKLIKDTLTSLEGWTGFIEGVADAVLDLLKFILGEVWKKIKAKLNVVDLFQDSGILPKGGLSGFLIDKLQEAFGGKINLSNIFKKVSFTGEEEAKQSLLSKIGNKISSIWNNLPWNKDKKQANVDIEADITLSDKGKKKLEDVGKDVTLQFEDAKLGKITATTIEVDIFKGDSLEVKDMFAKTLTLTDIFADTLKVKAIETEQGINGKKMDEYNAPNTFGVESGVLSKNDTMTVRVLEVLEKVTAPVLEVSEKITVPVIEIDDKITAPLLEIVDKITAPLIEVTDKITTALLEADKLKAVLAEIEKMEAENLKVKKVESDLAEFKHIEFDKVDSDKMTTELLEIKKMVVDKFDTDNIKLTLIDTDLLKAESIEAEKIVTILIEATEIIAQKLKASEIITGTITATTINATTINADSLNVDRINSQLLNVGEIVADNLRVGNIEGNINGGSGGGSYGGGSYGFYGLSDTGYLKKPTFEKGDRWSDISGLVPSAEDFLDGISDYYNSALNGLTATGTTADGNMWGMNTLPRYGAGSSNTIDSGSIVPLSDFDKNMSSVLAGAKIKELPDTAQYIHDYLMSFIGNENGVFGLMGNLYAESGLRSNNLQDTSNAKLGMTDEEYTDYANKNGFKYGNGYGLAQWTTADRLKGLSNTLNGRSVDNLQGQLEYLKKELTSSEYASTLNKLRNASSIGEASDAALYGFEKPKNQDSSVAELRMAYGQEIAGLLGTGGGTYNIPDEPVPLADTPEEPNTYSFDEANVIDKGKESTGGTQFSFLDSLPLQTEYTMAEVYNVIDKWLGRIYKLFKSFKVDDFLDELLDLEDLKLDLEGALGIDELENLSKLLKETNKLLKDLLKEIKKNTEALEKLTNAVKDLKEACDKLRDAIKDLIRNINELISSIDKLRDSVDELNDSVKELNETCKELLKAVRDLTNEIRNLIGSVDDLTDSVDTLTDEIRNLSPKVDDLTDSVDALTEEIANLNTYMEELINVINELIDTIRDLIDKCDELQTAIEELTEAIKDLGDKIDDLREAIEALAEKVQELIDKIDELIETLDTLILEIGELISAIRDLITSCDNLKEAIETLTDAVNDLKISTDGNTASLDELTNAVNELADKVDELKEAVEELTTAVRDLITKIGELITAVNQLTTAIRDLIAKMGELITAINQLMSAIRALADKLSNLDNDIKELTNAIRDLINCCLGSQAAMRDLIDAIERWIEVAKDTGHLDRNTEAKSANTKAVESLTDAIYKWITAAQDTGHLDRNTVAKSNNTKAVEAHTQAIQSLQGALGHITCNCNCGGNCGNCAMGGSSGGSGGGSTSTGNHGILGTGANGNYYGYKNNDGTYAYLYATKGGQRQLVTSDMSNDFKQAILNGTAKLDLSGYGLGSLSDAWSSSDWANYLAKQWGNVGGTGSTTGGTGTGTAGATGHGTTGNGTGSTAGGTGYGTAGDTGHGTSGGYVEPNINNTDVRNQAGTGVITNPTNPTTPSNPSTSTNNNPTTPSNNNSTQNTNNNTNNQNQSKGVGSIVFDVNTGITTEYDANGNVVGQAQAAGVWGTDPTPKEAWWTGTLKERHDREVQQQEAAAQKQREQAEEIKRQQEALNSQKQIYTKDLIGTDAGGNLTQQAYDAAIAKVQGWRNEAQGFLNNVNAHGTEDQKRTAQAAYDNLMQNLNAKDFDNVDNSWYAQKYQALRKVSNDVDTATGLSDYADLRVGINNNSAKDTLGSLSRSQMATLVFSDRDQSGNEILFYTGAYGQGKQITSEAEKQKIRDYVKSKYNITADDLPDSPEAWKYYKAALKGGFGDATAMFKQYLIYTKKGDSSSAQPLLNTLKAMATANTSQASTSQANNSSKEFNYSAMFTDPSYMPSGTYTQESWISGSKTHDEPVVAKYKDSSGELVRIQSTKSNPFKGDINKITAENLEEFRWGGVTIEKDFFQQALDAWRNRISVKGYQMGGMPSSGELYVAREGGSPEFVGSFGRHTAVANNDQIVTAVANGVSMANDSLRSAIESQTTALEKAINDKNLDVTIGDRQIAEASRRGQQGMGKKFVD